MGSRETLETALLSSWDRDTLAVYADHLLAEGDPRGELIALDLQIEATGNTAELAKRRTSLLFAWLGALVPVDDVHASWVGDSLRFGFVDELEFSGVTPNGVGRLAQALASPAGPYIRALSMIGRADELAPALAEIARHRHRWLGALTITGWHHGTIDPEIVAAALRAMPNLRTLVLGCPAVVSPLSHPTIEKLVVRGRDVYAALGEGARFDAVRRLELDLRELDFDEVLAEELEVVPPAAPPLPTIAFPALAHLDLAGSLDAVLAFLRGFAPRVRLRSLRIPYLRSAAERGDLEGAIRDMPALETIEVAHGSYYAPPDLATVKIVGASVWPWPRPEAAQRAGLRVFMPGAKYGDTVALSDAVEAMETAYETLPPMAREAWARLWRALPPKGSLEFPADVLASAVEAIPALMTNGWRELREELSSRRPLAAAATVKLERCRVD